MIDTNYNRLKHHAVATRLLLNISSEACLNANILLLPSAVLVYSAYEKNRLDNDILAVHTAQWGLYTVRSSSRKPSIMSHVSGGYVRDTKGHPAPFT
jgi:hypothetical protein